MSCRLTALSVFFLLFHQSIDLTHAQSLSSLPDFDLPKVDGSPVEDTCRIFFVTTPATTTTTTTTPTPITRKKVVATAKKPAVQSPPRKPETKKSGTPIRPQPAPARPITNSLLYYLLANSRGHAAGSLPGLPMGGLPHRGYSSSDSDELAATLLKRVGRTKDKRRKIGSFSSEDSSDES